MIILDLMMPEPDGMEVCKILKRDRKTSHIPIIMVTAKGEEIDRLLGFELGADDYITKPFSVREMVLRVRAVLRRGAEPKGKQEGFLQAKNVRLDKESHTVWVEEKKKEFTLIEFRLLEEFLSHPGRVFMSLFYCAATTQQSYLTEASWVAGQEGNLFSDLTDLFQLIVYARHGHKLMGCKSPL